MHGGRVGCMGAGSAGTRLDSSDPCLRAVCTRALSLQLHFLPSPPLLPYPLASDTYFPCHICCVSVHFIPMGRSQIVGSHPCPYPPMHPLATSRTLSIHYPACTHYSHMSLGDYYTKLSSWNRIIRVFGARAMRRSETEPMVPTWTGNGPGTGGGGGKNIR